MLRSAGFPQRLKPHPLRNLFGTAEAVPFYRAMPPFQSAVVSGRTLRILNSDMARKNDCCGWCGTLCLAGGHWLFPCLEGETRGTRLVSVGGSHVSESRHGAPTFSRIEESASDFERLRD